MLSKVTTLYENCDSTKITLHSISNPELNRISQKYFILRKLAFELENIEALLTWTSFIRKLLFAWSYSPLSFDISSTNEIQSEYEKISELWRQRKDSFQSSIQSSIDELLDGLHGLSSPEASLNYGYSKISHLHFDQIYVCQKHWGWGIDNNKLADSSGIKRLTQSTNAGAPSERACFFGSPRIYALKGLSGIWTAPRFKEIHFIIHDHTGLQIPGWKTDSINFDGNTNTSSPWNNQVTTNILISAPFSENPDDSAVDKTDLEYNGLGIKELIDNLNSQHYSGSSEDEVFCVLLLTEDGKVIPIRQHSKPDCLILASKITLEAKEAEDITSGDVILIRSSGGNTLKELESRKHDDEWESALSLHREWKDALLQLIDTGLISEIKESVNQTPQSIRNWSNPENHGPDKKETFIALMEHLGLNSDTNRKWETIQALREIGHSIGTDATETLKADFLDLNSSEQRKLSKDGTLTKYLDGDSEAAAMTAIRISDVLSYSAKIRPALINHILTPDNIPWL